MPLGSDIGQLANDLLGEVRASLELARQALAALEDVLLAAPPKRDGSGGLPRTAEVAPSTCETLLKNFDAMNPKTNKALLAYYLEKLSACSGPQYTQAVNEIKELLKELQNPPS
jgi:nitric oxide reductase activation protein